MAVKFGITGYSRVGDVVTFTLVALNADGTIDTGYTGSFTWGLNNMSDPGTPTFTAGDQGQLTFSTTILNPSVRTGLAANFPGSSMGANLSVSGPSGTNVSFGNQGDHLIVGGAGNDTITGNNGNDLFRLEQGGNENVNGSNGDDRFYFGAAYTSADVANGGAGTDRLLLQGNYGAGVTLGSLLAVESVTVLAGDDATYDGQTGTNLFYLLTADAGTIVSNNRLTIDGSALRVGELLAFDGTASGIDFTVLGGAGNDTLAGGSGNDTISYAEAAGGVTVSLAAAGAQDTVGAGFDTLSGFENVTGSDFADTLTGNAGNNIIDGGAGADNMTGGDGDDTYYVDDAGDLVAENAGEGNDRVVTSVSYGLAAGSSVEVLEAAAGADPINLTGTAAANSLIGNAGANILDGAGGGDVMTGGAGDDLYYVHDSSDVVVELAGEGNDRVYASVSFALAAGVSVELLTTQENAGTAAIDLTGNELANTIYGNAGGNALDGGDGNDVLIGLAGDDLLIGGLGDDSFVVEDAGDRIVELAGEGNDRVYASVSYALEAGVSVEKLTTNALTGTAAIDLTGNELAQEIYGNDGANILDGAGGADTLIGRLGDDWYFVDEAGDRVVELAGEGNDRVFASTSYTLRAGVSVEKVTTASNTGTQAIDLTGNELANILYGNAGNNVLNGGGGADTLFGLAGDDWYVVDHAGDRVVEAAGEGNDRVFASISYTLAAGVSVEKLTTDSNAGTAAINLTGNELAQEIYGNNGDNVLNGGGGGDLLAGLLGNDWYILTDANDVIVELAGQGNDRVFAGVSYTLDAGVSVEKLTTSSNTGTAAIDLTGNELANTIYGNDGDNVLNGGGGADVLFGLAGADTFAFTTALGGGNIDRIVDFVSGTDRIALDDAIFATLGGLGALDPNAFHIGTSAADADDRIIYHAPTGTLFYDADGVGGAAAVHFATLQGAPVLTASDFVLI